MTEQALAIVRLSLELSVDVWKSMTPEQKQYWIAKGISNDQAVVSAVESFLKALGIEVKK